MLSEGNVSVLRDVAVIILALEGAVFTLVAVSLLAVVNYGLFRFRWWHRVATWLTLARRYLDLGQRAVERACRAAVSPLMIVSATRAGLARGVRELLPGRGESGLRIRTGDLEPDE